MASSDRVLSATDKQADPTGGGQVVLNYVRERVTEMIGASEAVGSVPILNSSHLNNLYFDLRARAEMGKEKYGTYLRTNNGRNAALDLYQELLDAIMYASQGRMEGDDVVGNYVEILISLAAQVCGVINQRNSE